MSEPSLPLRMTELARREADGRILSCHGSKGWYSPNVPLRVAANDAAGLIFTCPNHGNIDAEGRR